MLWIHFIKYRRTILYTLVHSGLYRTTAIICYGFTWCVLVYLGADFDRGMLRDSHLGRHGDVQVTRLRHQSPGDSSTRHIT